MLAWAEPTWRFSQELNYEKIKIGMVSGVRGERGLLVRPTRSVLMKQAQECFSWAHTEFFVPSAASGSGIPWGPLEISWFTFSDRVLPHHSGFSDLTSSQEAAGDKVESKVSHLLTSPIQPSWTCCPFLAECQAHRRSPGKGLWDGTKGITKANNYFRRYGELKVIP